MSLVAAVLVLLPQPECSLKFPILNWRQFTLRYVSGPVDTGRGHVYGWHMSGETRREFGGSCLPRASHSNVLVIISIIIMDINNTLTILRNVAITDKFQ